MKQVLVFHQFFATGSIDSEPVQIPQDWTDAYVDVLGAINQSDVNIFDIALALQISDDGVEWQNFSKDSASRQIGDTAPVMLCSTAGWSGCGGKWIRARISLGQGVIHVCVVANAR